MADERPSPPLKAFGDKVRDVRVEAGSSQADAARAATISKSHIGKIERGRTRCSRVIAEALDKAFNSGDTLVSLWDELVRDAALPVWFDWPKVEADRDTLTLDSYESLVVPGLLQTEAYASALFSGDTDKIAFRMERQNVFDRVDPPPPRMSFLVSETVLITQVGDGEVMREQLERLLSLESPRVSIQVIPHPMPPSGTDGSFCLATLASRSPLAYVETPARGFTLSDREDIETISGKLADIRANALPASLSRECIKKIMEERWT